MHDLIEFAHLLGGMPFWTLIAAVVLGGFALAAFAIYAVLAATRGRS